MRIKKEKKSTINDNNVKTNRHAFHSSEKNIPKSKNIHRIRIMISIINFSYKYDSKNS